MRRLLTVSSLTLVPLVNGGCGRPQPPTIEGVPANQQEVLFRHALGPQWPFNVAEGTVACDNGAVLFRGGKTTYAVNGAAASKGFASIDPITLFEGSGPPSNPLGRIKQDDRTQIFAESSVCGKSPNAAACKGDLRRRYKLSDADLAQIEAEGRERRWPPLPRLKVSLQPVIDRGLKLCESK